MIDTTQDSDDVRRDITRRFDQLAVMIRRTGGIVHEHLGDEMLAEFRDPSDALCCALAVQSQLLADGDGYGAPLRIGLDVGEVIMDRGSVWGRSIVQAQRVEQLATPGGVCVSESVHTAVDPALPVTFEDLGERLVKNTTVRAFRAALADGGVLPAPGALPLEAAQDPDGRPTVAVIPLANQARDPAMDEVCAGITADVITRLEQFRTFPVAPRAVIAHYDGHAFDARQVGKDLGAVYIVSGALRKQGSQVRVSMELVSAELQTTLWTASYNGDVDNLRTLRDNIALNAAAMLEPELERAEIRQPLPIPDAARTWHFLRRGLWHQYRLTREDAEQALHYFELARAQSPNSVDVLIHLAWWHWWHGVSRRDGQKSGWRDVLEILDTLSTLSPDDSRTLCLSGIVAIMQGHHDEAYDRLSRAVDANPCNADAICCQGTAQVLSGRPELALEPIQTSLSISPYRFGTFHAYGELGCAHYLLGNWDEAARAAGASLQLRPGYWIAHVVRTGALARGGHAMEASAALSALISVRGDQIANDIDWWMFADRKWNRYMLEGLELAGWEGPLAL